MKTLLPSGVWTYPVPAASSNVRVVPDRVPGVQTMPIFGEPAGNASAVPGARIPAPARSATTMPSRRVLRVMVAFFPRRAVARSDIGLAHDRLGRKRRLIDPHLGHHPARSGWCAEVRQ